MSQTVVLGTRGSRLARWQTDWVANRLRSTSPGITIDIRIIQTAGDRDQTSPIHQIGVDGAFTKQLELELFAGTIDLAVHSLKDLPTTLPEGLTIGAVPVRATPLDALLSASGYTVETLPQAARVGTSSVRRAAQIRLHRPDLVIVPVRGNVDTRVKRIGVDLDALIMAAAGIERLGITSVAVVPLSPDVMLPAPGQGALAVECRSNDALALSLLAAINDPAAEAEVEAERTLLNVLGGGCLLPIAAQATLSNGQLTLSGLVVSPDSSRSVRGSLVAPVTSLDDARLLAGTLAKQLLADGAAEILAFAL